MSYPHYSHQPNCSSACRQHELTPCDIDFVIATHGHSDHIGNLNHFPNPTHIIVCFTIVCNWHGLLMPLFQLLISTPSPFCNKPLKSYFNLKNKESVQGYATWSSAYFLCTWLLMALYTYYVHHAALHIISPSLPINTSCETVYGPIPWDKEIHIASVEPWM